MARWFQLLGVALVFAFALMQIGEGLECYHCVGLHGSECDLKPSSNPSFKKNCTDPSHVCYVRNTTVIGGGQVNRECAPANECGDQPGTKAKDHETTCNTCTKDLCNTSSNIVPSFFITSIVAVVFTSIYRYAN